MRRFLILGVMVAAAALVGCGGDDGDDSEQGGSGGNGGTGGIGGIGGTGGNGECTDLQNLAPQITEQDVAEAPPAPEGLIGITSLAEGLYYFTADTVYTGPGGSSGPTDVTHKDTWRITGTTVELAHWDAQSGQTLYGTATFTIAGTALNVTFTCPAAMAGTQTTQFTADSTHIYVFDDDLNNVDTYTLQP